jgi:RIO kinase 1
LWVEKEYRNLQRSSSANVSSPKPILVRKNILLMELLGQNGTPFPLLKNCPEYFTESMLKMILKQITILFNQAGLVHADLSPYNILIGKNVPYFIDMSQSVLVSHPKALKFLKRDLTNVISAFSIKNIRTPDITNIYDKITKDYPDKNLSKEFN